VYLPIYAPEDIVPRPRASAWLFFFVADDKVIEEGQETPKNRDLIWNDETEPVFVNFELTRLK